MNTYSDVLESEATDSLDACQTKFVHRNTIQAVRDAVPGDAELNELADFFRIFGDSTRIKILCALTVSEMCVCDLSELLEVSQSAMSHQLKTLRQAGLVKHRRAGKTVFYSLKDDHVKKIFDMGVEHLGESDDLGS